MSTRRTRDICAVATALALLGAALLAGMQLLIGWLVVLGAS